MTTRVSRQTVPENNHLPFSGFLLAPGLLPELALTCQCITAGWLAARVKEANIPSQDFAPDARAASFTRDFYNYRMIP